MTKHAVYEVPVVGSPDPGDDDPLRPKYEAELSADSANYNRHYRIRETPSRVYIATDVRIPTWEEADDVTVLDPDEQDLSAYHSPSELAEMRGVSLEEMHGTATDDPDDDNDDTDDDADDDDDDDEGESPDEPDEGGDAE